MRSNSTAHLPPLLKSPPAPSLAQLPPLPHLNTLPFLVDHGNGMAAAFSVPPVKPNLALSPGSKSALDPWLQSSRACKALMDVEPPLVKIIVVSAMTGDVVTSMSLPGKSSVASFKLEVEKATGKSAFCLHFLLENGNSLECCQRDFDSLETALGGSVSVRLALVASQASDGGLMYMALPFDVPERDYLPASGLVDSALGMVRRPAVRPLRA